MINYKTNSLLEKIKTDSIPVVLFGAGDIGELVYQAFNKRKIVLWKKNYLSRRFVTYGS